MVNQEDLDNYGSFSPLHRDSVDHALSQEKLDAEIAGLVLALKAVKDIPEAVKSVQEKIDELRTSKERMWDTYLASI